MADIKNILEKALGGKISKAEIEALASALQTSKGSGGGVSDAIEARKAQIAFAEAVGDTNQILEGQLQLKKDLVQQAAQRLQQAIEEGKETDALVARYRSLSQELERAEQNQQALNIRTQEAAEINGVLGSAISNVGLGYYNMSANGITTLGVIGKLSGAFKKKTKVVKDATKAQDDYQKELDETTEKQGKLGKAASAAGSALDKAFSSGLGQQIRKMGDPLAQLTNQGRLWADISKEMQSANQELYKSTGLSVKSNMEHAYRLGKIGDASKSLLMQDKALHSAMTDLHNSFAFFNKESVTTQKHVIETTALLEKAGVSTGTTADMFVFFTKTMGETGKEAAAHSRKLLELSEAMGQAPEKTGQAFQSARRYLAGYGRDYMKTFGKMLTISGKLGIEIGKLMGAFDDMDKISASSDVAARLNAILPGLRIDTLKLQEADVPDKIRMVMEKVGATNADLNDKKNRTLVKAIADSIPGLDPEDVKRMAEAQKKGGLEDEIAKMSSLAQEDSMTNKKLDERNAKAMTSDQIAQKNLQKGQLDMVNAVSKVQTTMAENVWWVKAIAAGISIMGTVMGAGKAISAAKAGAGGFLKGFKNARASGKSGVGALLGGIKGGASGLAQEGMKVFVTNWPAGGIGGGGGDGGGGGGLSDFIPDGGGGGRRRRRGRRGRRGRRRRRSTGRRRGRTRRRRRRRGGRRGRGRGAAGMLLGLGADAAMGSSPMDMIPQSAGEVAQMAGEEAVERVVTRTLSRRAATQAATQAATRSAATNAARGAATRSLATRGAASVGGRLVSAAGPIGAVAGAGMAGWEIGSAIWRASQSESDLAAMENQKFSDSLKTFVTGEHLKHGLGTKPTQSPAYKGNRKQWGKMSTQQKESHCDKNSRPPMGVDPGACSDLWKTRRGRFDKLIETGGDEQTIVKMARAMGMNRTKMMAFVQKAHENRPSGNPKTPQKNDWWGDVNQIKAATNSNQSDEIVGVKEGGLLARKLDRLIQLMELASGGKPIELKLDSKVIAKSVVSVINNDLYKAR